jgi:cytoskeletal protein CcmA (bactofilin family)
VAQLHSAKVRYSALSAALRSGREFKHGPFLDVASLQTIAVVKSVVDLPMVIEPGGTSLSCIGRGIRISGKLNFRELAKIEGEVEGEIIGDEIEIATSAVVRARITANRIRVAGQVNGEIVARERVEVLPTGRLRCTITTPKLVISEGAQFDGECKMPGGRTIPPQPEPQETKVTRVSVFITEAHKAELRERGYSDEEIALMIPAVAHHILGLR